MPSSNRTDICNGTSFPLKSADLLCKLTVNLNKQVKLNFASIPRRGQQNDGDCLHARFRVFACTQQINKEKYQRWHELCTFAEKYARITFLTACFIGGTHFYNESKVKKILQPIKRNTKKKNESVGARETEAPILTVKHLQFRVF